VPCWARAAGLAGGCRCGLAGCGDFAESTAHNSIDAYGGDGAPLISSIEGSASCPHWSPDGRLLAFSRDFDVYVATPGGRTRSLTRTNAAEFVIGWLGDPPRVAFLRAMDESRAAEIYAVAPRADARPRLVGRLPRAVDPRHVLALSPDGRHLVSEDSWEIYDLASSSSVGLEGTQRFASGPSWSPDGRLLAFVGAQRGIDDFVVIADTNGRIVRRLGPAYLGDVPAWSWDGGWIAYANAPKGLGSVARINVVRADGTGHRVLRGRTDVENGLPAWSPDGRTIVYQSGGTLRKTSLDGIDEELSDPGGGADECPRFSPDGRRIAFRRSAPSGFLHDPDSTVVLMASDGSAQRAVRTR
jgi:Tol biopolymer transport system component